jgi:hypothetical protein
MKNKFNAHAIYTIIPSEKSNTNNIKKLKKEGWL